MRIVCSSVHVAFVAYGGGGVDDADADADADVDAADDDDNASPLATRLCFHKKY